MGYYNVGTEGVLAECAPGLEVKDLAEYVLPCYEIEGGFEENYWTYVEGCVFSNIGWLNKDTSINVAKFEPIPGISDQVTQCMSKKKKKRLSLPSRGSGGGEERTERRTKQKTKKKTARRKRKGREEREERKPTCSKKVAKRSD